MSIVAAALSYQRLLGDSPTLRMLRADNLALMAAILRTHLGTPGARISADELHELIDGDLDTLRDRLDLSAKNAKAYCDDWRNAGILIRRPTLEARGETYELSAAGFDALRMLDQLETPRSTVTESRLVSLASALRALAIETDPDSSRRLAALRRERDRIEAEIERIQRDDQIGLLDERQATERTEDILLQAQSLPADFARVRARFETINQELRTSILDTDATQSAVLDDIFRGVDLIEASEEGRTFAAFSALLRDPERHASLDDDIAAILDRDFAKRLSPEARRSLRMLVREMKHGSRDVHQILTEFARGLRRYVHSQEFQQDRALRGLLHEALAAGVEASRQVKPYAALGHELEIPAMRLSSAGELIPHDPAQFDAGTPLVDAAEGSVDYTALAALARESEIDFAELVDNVNETVDAIGEASVAEVLVRHPATQGLASIVGLLSLATQQGEVASEADEELYWSSVDGVGRSARVNRHRFVRKVAG